MEPEALNDQIADIHTHWSKLLAPDHEILRYYGAVHRYLWAMVGDPVTAKELANEFAIRFLAGKFKHADPAQGRLRDLIKTTVRNLAIDYWRMQKKAKKAISLAESKLADQLLAGTDDPQTFECACRDDYLAQAWNALGAAEKADGKPFFTILKFKVDHPDLHSDDAAQRIAAILKKPTSAAAYRQTLHRARSLFADLLLDSVGRATDSTDLASLEEELIELKLLDYCKSALTNRKKA